MQTHDKTVWLTAGTVVAAATASLCCILPIAVVVLGVGSAALGAAFEPLRPYFTAATITLLALGFYYSYRPQPPCGPDEACRVAEKRGRQRRILWIIAVVALLLVTFPYYVGWLI